MSRVPESVCSPDGLLLKVSATLPQGEGGFNGWVGGSKTLFRGFWEAWTPPPGGGDGIFLGARCESLVTEGH